MNALVDMTGKTIKDAVVLGRCGMRGSKPAWRCRCKCGEEFVAAGTTLRESTNPACISCSKAMRIAGATKHRAVGTREYVTWNAMKARCYYEKNKRYARYGGRGIRVCQRWLDSFNNFLEDMGHQPSSAHSIERIDKDKDYCPENCKWATLEEQANNRSNNRPIEIDGRVKNLSQWAKESGVHRTVIARRLGRGIAGTSLIKKATKS